MDRFLNQIICGDCINVLRDIPDNSVDMCFADPPFNLNKKYNEYKDDVALSSYGFWCYTWIQELRRITKQTGSIFIHHIPKYLVRLAAYLTESRAYFRHWIAWDAPGAPLGKTLLPAHYGILWYTKDDSIFKFYDLRKPHKICRHCGKLLADYGGKKHLQHSFGPLLSDVWTDIHRIRHKKRRDDHPCQLPAPLLDRLILMTTDEDDVVLDPFVGTGTTVISAFKLNRKYVGIDIDPKYVDIAKKKLEDIKDPFLFSTCSFHLGETVTVREDIHSKLRK